jgi:hypothetical protein
LLFKKIILPIVGLAILASIVLGLLKLSQSPRLEWGRIDVQDKLAVVYENVTGFFHPARKPPISTLELEENLRAYLPVPFVEFSQDDWDWLWHILYGKFTEDSPYWPRRKRQLDKQEIQNVLADYFPRPFASFKQRQWDIFWQEVLQGKVFH